MRGRAGVALVSVCLWLAGSSCRGSDDNKLEVYVDALLAESGALTDDASNALVARGSESIVILEAGLYRASADGRRRILRTLGRIGDPAAQPIYEHLAALDPDEDVRALAARLGKVKPAELTKPASDAKPGACPKSLKSRELAPGLTLERVQPAVLPTAPAADPCLWILRFDPAKFELKLLSSSIKEAREPSKWIEEHGLVAVTNAAMYIPSGKPTGLAISDGNVVNGRDHPSYSAFFAFGPRSESVSATAMVSRSCGGFDLPALKKSYRSIVQNYRLLDCDGKAIKWKDPKMHSAAAVAIDDSGFVAFVHMVAPYRMQTFSRVLADPALRFVAAMYVEGGTPAQLSVLQGRELIERRGAYELLGLRRGGGPEKLPVVLGIKAIP